MKRFFASLYCCLLSIGGFCQTLLETQNLTIEDGLSQGYVSFMHQDSSGFLWFGTKNGLNRFDGESFEVFTHDRSDPYSLSSEWISAIYEHGDFLLVGTYGATLNLFHKKSKRSYQIPLEAEQLEPFLFFKYLIKVSANRVWILSEEENQLLELHFPDQFWEKLPEEESLLEQVTQSVVIRDVNKILLNYDGQILAQRGAKLLQFNKETYELAYLDSSALYQQYRLFPIAPSIRFYLAHEDYSIRRVDILKSGKWEALATDIVFSPLLYYEEDAGRLWVQEDQTNNLLVFDTAAFVSHAKLMKRDALFVIDDIKAGATSWIKDRSGVIWIGTGGYGIKKISPRNLKIKTFLSGLSIYNRIYSSEPGEILFNNPLGLIYIKPESGTHLEAVHQFLKATSPERWTWRRDGPAQGWLVTVEATPSSEKKFQAVLYHYSEKQFSAIQRVGLNVFWNDSKINILETDAHQFFISFANKIIHYNPGTEQQQIYSFDLFKKEIPPHVFSIAQTADEAIWIGTSEGLVRGIREQDDMDFQLIKKGLRNSICASLLTDPNNPNILWVGTKGGGLHRLDTRTMSFEYLNAKNGLPNDVIYGVLADDEGNLWMSSNKGIVRYTPATGLIRNFTSEDGMQSDEFNTYAYGKSPDGRLLFGGINGINVFKPEDLNDNLHIPEIRFTGLEVNNQPIDVRDSSGILKESIEYTSLITLPFSKNSLSLSFAALEFTAPGKNRFKYYLEGAEAEWAHQTTENKAQYLNLSPGSYTFKIKAANGDSVWSDQVHTLDIVIHPPWYRSTLAYLVYGVLVALGLWQIFRFQKRRFQLRHQVELEQREAERLKELDQAKSKLYTNITHEFRTPLTVISGMAQRIKDNDDAKSLIQRNAGQLLNLVNQMLDLRKLESGHFAIHKIQGDIVRHLRYLTESLESYATSQGLAIHFLADEPALLMDFDPEKMTRIFSNLMSNAIKFTPEGGDIYVQTLTEADRHFVLKVKDSGIGIAEDQLPHIFNRFYQVDGSSTRRGEGTGIGLTLVSELVKAMGGSLKVASIAGEGSTFTVRLPITNLAAEMEGERTASSGPGAAVLTTILPAPDHEMAIAATDSNKPDEKPTILLMEDNADVIHYLIGCLQDQYFIEIAMNGAEGTEKAIETIPDLIISDVMMPEKDGFEVCQTLKTDERTSHIPIILLTAKADFESRLEGLQRGADAYLQKPFHQEELLIILRSQLELRKKLQAHFAQWSQLADHSEKANISTAETNLQLDKEDAFLQKIRAIIEADLSNNDIGMPQLVRGLSMSRSQIYKKVKALTGHSPSIYIRSIRLYHARHLLKTSDLNVSEIAYEVGFSSPVYFSDVFLETFGVRPNETRK